MDDISRELLRGTSQPRFSTDDLSEMGKRASRDYLCGVSSLNDAIVKVAREKPGITVHHIQRVVEFANNETFQSIFEKQAGDKNIDFDVADPRDVLRTLDVEARPAAEVVSFDYGADPTKLANSDRKLEADLQLAEIFGVDPMKTAAMVKTGGSDEEVAALKTEAIGHVKKAGAGADLVRADLESAVSLEKLKEATARIGQYDEANPHGGLIRTRQELSKMAEDLTAMYGRNQTLLKEAMDKLSFEVKQHMLAGGNLGEVVDAMGSVNDGQRVKEAMDVFIPELERHGLSPTQARVDAIYYEMTKNAHRVVNPDSPIVESFAALVKLADGQETLHESVKTTNAMLAEADAMLAKIASRRSA